MEGEGYRRCNCEINLPKPRKKVYMISQQGAKKESETENDETTLDGNGQSVEHSHESSELTKNNFKNNPLEDDLYVWKLLLYKNEQSE